MAIELATSSLNTRFGIISALYTNATTYSAAAGNTPLQFMPVYSSYFPINLSAATGTCVPIYTVPTGYKLLVTSVAMVLSGGFAGGTYTGGQMPQIYFKEGNTSVYNNFSAPSGNFAAGKAFIVNTGNLSTSTDRSLVTTTLCAVTIQSMAGGTGYTELSAACLISGFLIKV
jgi:hypothetical protein